MLYDEVSCRDLDLTQCLNLGIDNFKTVLNNNRAQNDLIDRDVVGYIR